MMRLLFLAALVYMTLNLGSDKRPSSLQLPEPRHFVQKIVLLIGNLLLLLPKTSADRLLVFISFFHILEIVQQVLMKGIKTTASENQAQRGQV